jgi:hypothetical protein
MHKTGHGPQRRGTFRKDGARSAKTEHGRNLPNFCVVLCIFLCSSMYCLFCVAVCIVCMCICVLNYCHRVATQLQLNISYHIKSTAYVYFADEICVTMPLVSRKPKEDGKKDK